VAGLLGRILGIPELFGLAAAAVVVALAALVYVRVAKRSVTIGARAVPPVVEAGETVLIEVTIEEARSSGSPSTSIRLVADDTRHPPVHQPAGIAVPPLGRSGRARATFEIPTSRRGVVAAGAYEAVATDPLGLARQRLGAGRAATCVVLPRVEPLASVLPRGLAPAGAESTRSAAERLITGSSSLRRYAEGDDLRRVHWRTTARRGELMVREGGDREDEARMATTVLLDAGDPAEPPGDLDRAVEVAASVLAAAADASGAGVSGAYRLVTTSGFDSGSQRGREGLAEVLVALAGLCPAPGPTGSERLRAALGRLGRPDRDEVLVVVGAFGDTPPDPVLLATVARSYSAVVLVLVGAEEHVPPGGPAPYDRGVLTVPLPTGSPLWAVWSLEPAEVDLAERLGAESQMIPSGASGGKRR
jgi:uncharacterized protein (DUF58 family)